MLVNYKSDVHIIIYLITARINLIYFSLVKNFLFTRFICTIFVLIFLVTFSRDKQEKKIGKFEYNILTEKGKYVYAIASRRTDVSWKLLFSLGKPNYCRTDCALINDTFYATAFSFNIVGNIRNDNTISSVRRECAEIERIWKRVMSMFVFRNVLFP